jgi:hypothetical protein
LNQSHLRVLLCVVSFLLPHGTHAADVLDVLGPNRIGTELGAVLQGITLNCRQDPKQNSIRQCNAVPGSVDTLHSVPVAALIAIFRDEHLEQVTIHFAESRFPEVKALLSAQLGQAEDASFTVRAGMAGTFTNDVMVWESVDWVAIARQYDGKIDRSSLIYGTPDALVSLLTRTRMKLPGARDL